MKEKRFTINGMKCAGCVSALETGLSKVKGVNKVTASHKDNCAIISYNEGLVSPEQLREEVKNIGFEMSLD